MAAKTTSMADSTLFAHRLEGGEGTPQSLIEKSAIICTLLEHEHHHLTSVCGRNDSELKVNFFTQTNMQTLSVPKSQRTEGKGGLRNVVQNVEQEYCNKRERGVQSFPKML